MFPIVAAFLLGGFSPPPDEHDDDHARPPAVQTAGSVAKSDAEDEKAQPLPSRRADRDSDDDEEEGRTRPDSTIIVSAHRLDAARTQIDASLGATVYSLTNEAIENRPGGETGRVSEILTQAPGVTLSGRTLSVRGSPPNQVRINNVIVPEAISDPADFLSSRLAQTTRLITGTLPAQFAFAPAGVISITTKNGLYEHGGQAELFAASDGMIEPAVEWTGSVEGTSLFASGEVERDRSTVSDIRGNSAHDRLSGIDGLAFADHIIDPNSRISLIVGGSHEQHRIGSTSISSGLQTSDNAYAVASYQHTAGTLVLEASLFTGISSDEARFSAATRERRSSWGTQIDGTDTINSAQTLRFGLLASRQEAHELGMDGDRLRASRTPIALYAQDEWKLAPALTFNPGGRIEWLRGLGSRPTFEPRASLVWDLPAGLTAHVGYARYASAPPLGENLLGADLRDERDDYLDAGVQQKLGWLTLGIDGYWRSADNYIAEHQVPGTAPRSAFEFKRARIKGVELSATFARRGTTAWANLSFMRAHARTIIAGESMFPATTVAAASHRFIPLDTDRPVTLSGGFTQRIGMFSLGADLLASSGTVRTLAVAEPNSGRRSRYAVLGVAAVYHARIAGRPADLRLDLSNVSNVHYATSDAASLQGGWTHWGRGRTLTIGVEQGF